MTVSTYVGITVLDDYELAVAPQTTSGVHNSTIRRSKNRLAQFTGDINSFIPSLCDFYGLNQSALLCFAKIL